MKESKIDDEKVISVKPVNETSDGEEGLNRPVKVADDLSTPTGNARKEPPKNVS